MIVLQIAGLILWLILIPFCMGLLPAMLMKKEDRTPGCIFVSGYLVMFALFELIGIPIAITVIYHSFSLLSNIFAAAALLLSALGVVAALKKHKKGDGLMPVNRESLKAYHLEDKLYFLIFFLLVGFQLYMVFTRASFDGDDAYYGVQGLIAQQKDTIYRINPYTGRSAPLDTRHVMALIPVWEAFIGRMSGIHATIIAHSVAPLVLLPLTYLVYFRIGKKLFSGKKQGMLRGKNEMFPGMQSLLPVFMIIMALFQIFGNVSIYTNETFLLTRTWQGKSVAGNFMIPAVFWIFLCLFEQKDREEGDVKVPDQKVFYLLLACLNLAAGISSSLAVLLCSLLTAGLGVLFAIRERKFSILIKAGLTCVPGALYVLTYLIISH